MMVDNALAAALPRSNGLAEAGAGKATATKTAATRTAANARCLDRRAVMARLYAPARRPAKAQPVPRGALLTDRGRRCQYVTGWPSPPYLSSPE
jgi:hypothetical protein